MRDCRPSWGFGLACGESQVGLLIPLCGPLPDARNGGGKSKSADGQGPEPEEGVHGEARQPGQVCVRTMTFRPHQSVLLLNFQA